MPPNVYFGSVESELHGQRLHVSAARYGADARIPAHEHANAYVCINTAAGFLERSGRAQHEVRTHDLVYHPAGHRHSDRFSGSGGHCLNLEVAPAWFAGMADARAPTAPIYANDPALRRIGRALIREALQPEGPQPPALDGLLVELLARFRGPVSRRNARPPRWLLAVRDRLRDACQQEHQLASLAATAGVHPVHLAREFHRQFGCTVHAWQLRCRVQAAAARLVAGDESMADLALDLGFNSQSHFTRVFGMHTGITPGTWRRRARERRR
jgi:AraC family transcriptional regulator